MWENDRLKYLGFCFGGNPLSLAFWNPVVGKVGKQLDGWKWAYISRGCRLTLVQLVLASFLTYFLSLFRMAEKIVMRI